MEAWEGLGVKKLEMDCCFVFWEALEAGWLLLGAIE